MIAFESWIFGYLLNSLWQLPMVFAAGWFAALLARPAGPRIEHRIWVGAFLLEAILPACPLRLGEQLRELWRLVPWGWTGNTATGHIRIAIGPGTTHENGVLRLPAIVLEAFLIAYGCSLLYFIGRLTWGLRKTAAARRHAAPVTLKGEAAQSWNRYSRTFAMGAAELATSAKTSVPVTLGLRQGVLLVPTGFLESVDHNDLDALFAHEFAHMRRRDFAKNLLYELLSLPMACHPLLWLTRSRVAESREMVCDAMAAEAVAGRENYARSLLRLASLLADPTPARTLHAIGIFDANIFERRIMNLTEKPVEIKGSRRLAITVACAAVALLTCASALALRIEVGATATASATQSGGTPATLRVSAEVMSGQRISGPIPIYPPQAKADKVQGPVILSLTINKGGEPINIHVKKSVRADVDESAVTAVQQWRWKPFLLNGDPVDVKTTVTVNYSLER
ncbi:MAG: M56 family metallopeptidase [Edaphobacter sp.]